jgi:hypothetical protein
MKENHSISKDTRKQKKRGNRNDKKNRNTKYC